MTFDASKHLRGQPKNKAQFRANANAEPESTLEAQGAQAAQLAGIRVGTRVIFRESETGTPEFGKVTEEHPPSESHPDGGLFTFEDNSGARSEVWWSELTPAETGSFTDDTNARVHIVQVEDGVFKAEGRDGAVTFRASGEADLVDAAINAWFDDDLDERGNGLFTMTEEQQKAVTDGYFNAAVEGGAEDTGAILFDYEDIRTDELEAQKGEIDLFVAANRGLVDRAVATPGYGDLAQVGKDFFEARNRRRSTSLDKLGELGAILRTNAEAQGYSFPRRDSERKVFFGY